MHFENKYKVSVIVASYHVAIEFFFFHMESGNNFSFVLLIEFIGLCQIFKSKMY